MEGKPSTLQNNQWMYLSFDKFDSWDPTFRGTFEWIYSNIMFNIIKLS
jgi:hypothetical protein